MIYIHLIRHGKTSGNIKRQYIGSSDESLCPEGIEELVQKKARGIYPLPEEMEPVIYSSPMRRCIETAKVLYPGFHIESIDGFQETDFGPFERKNYEQLCGLPEYREWIDSQGEIICAGMEKRSSFQKRCAETFETFIRKIDMDSMDMDSMDVDSKASNCETVDFMEDKQKSAFGDRHFVLVVHGGTIMALMQELGMEDSDTYKSEGHIRDFYRYQRENGCGITCSLVIDSSIDLQNNLGKYAGKKAKIRLKWEGNIG